MSITVTLAHGVELTLDRAAAARLLDTVRAALGDHDEVPVVRLDDSHPLWARHSGGAGHEGPEWDDGDEDLAEAFYAVLRGKAKLFFDLLLARPGERVTVDDMIALSEGTFSSSFSVAGAINGLRRPHEASGRRYPFYWWEGTPSCYAVKPSVASLFNRVRSRDVR